jgi:hypothetical protein
VLPITKQQIRSAKREERESHWWLDRLTCTLRIRGKLATAATVTPALAACTIGTAHTNGCPGIHWANNGYAHPQVYFVDHTGAAWPVDVATYTWNQAQGIDSIYVSGSCPGYSGTHCANMYDANYGATGWAGLTYTPVDSHLNIRDGVVYSKFNDYYGVGYTAAEHRQDTCHEQGHVLGLDHNDSTNSCIYYAIISSAPQYPDADDYAVLKSVYSYTH